MGENQKKLAECLGNESVTLLTLKHADIAASPYADAIYELYLALGGIQTHKFLKTRVGAWDMQYNGIAVELDEEQHFNRYRAETLTSGTYKQLPKFPLSRYQTYCKVHENSCLKKASRGGYWTNENCERQFGAANTKGNLTGDGAPRWKQRAFFDFIKDLAPLILGFNFVRIAVWGTVSISGRPTTIKEALKNPDRNIRHAVVELIQQRLHETLPPRA